jgi:AcrR family transcriptional regulator
MPPPRRLGAPDAKNRSLLLDAAEQLMLEEGYAAVTSRRVAQKAALKPQLVHYYFRTMDDLFLAAFRRRAEEGLAIHARAAKSPQPLWALWHFSLDPAATTLTMEYVALANHRKALKAEIAYFAELFREEQRKAVSAVLGDYGVDPTEVPPLVWSVLLTSVSRVLVMEQALGMSAGHDETLAFVEGWLHRLEGAPANLPAHQLRSHDGSVNRQIAIEA